MDNLFQALQYQLHERVVFVKAPDPVVADLLYSYAVVTAHHGTLEGALGLLQLAREYGFPDLALLDAQTLRFERALRWAKFLYFCKWAAGGLLVVLVLIRLHRRKIFFLSHRDYVAHRQRQAGARQ